MKTINNLNSEQSKTRLNLLNQIVMKKQILLLIVAFFAVSSAFGQATKGSAPRGFSCEDDALHPIAGKSYDYSALVAPTGGNYLWWATKDPEFIKTTSGTTSLNDGTKLTTAANGGLIETSANYGIRGAGTNVSITWTDDVLSKTKYNADPNIAPTVAAPSPTFVAVHYNGTTACNDNLKVYQLDPIKAFTVDIRNIEDGAKTILGYDVADDQCIDLVRGAKYVSGGTMEYDYGQNIFYFEVVAANFTGYFVPTLTVGGLNTAANQTATVEWTASAPSTWGTTAPTWTAYAAGTQITTSETNTNDGVSIYVRVTVANNKFENNITSHPLGVPITLTVDAQNSVGDWDIDNGAGDLCTTATAADNKDVATQTLLPRPEIKTDPALSTQAPNNVIIPGDEENQHNSFIAYFITFNISGLVPALRTGEMKPSPNGPFLTSPKGEEQERLWGMVSSQMVMNKDESLESIVIKISRRELAGSVLPMRSYLSASCTHAGY